jgi:hypothetical protein
MESMEPWLGCGARAVWEKYSLVRTEVLQCCARLFAYDGVEMFWFRGQEQIFMSNEAVP